MFLIASPPAAIFCLLLSLLCLGSWPALFSFVSLRYSRHPTHLFLDYSLAFFSSALLTALTLGQLGQPGPNFLDQLGQLGNLLPSLMFAAGGGVLLLLGNVSMQYGVHMTGLSICLPIQASLTVIIGTGVNYFLDGGLNRAVFLLPGVALFCAAIFCSAAAHIQGQSSSSPSSAPPSSLGTSADEGPGENELKMRRGGSSINSCAKPEVFYSGCKDEEDALAIVRLSAFADDDAAAQEEEEEEMASRGVADVGLEEGKDQDGEGEKRKLLGEPEQAEASERSRSPVLGLLVTAFGGLCFGFFSPLFNLATNDQFRLLPTATEPLTVYSSYFFFSLAFLLLSAIVNVRFMYQPPKVLQYSPSNLRNYFADNRGRMASLLAGVVCGLGNALQFMAGQAAGYAAADLVQAYPLVSSLWGVIFFGEFRTASRGAKILLAATCGLHFFAVVLLGLSAKMRN